MSLVPPAETDTPEAEHRERPEFVALRLPAVVGLIALATVVVASSRAVTPVGVTLERSFGGLLQPSTSGGTASAVLVVVALATLLACWWRVLHLAAHWAVSLPAVGVTCGLWLLPVLLAPPLLSLDAYAYLAHGTMLANGRWADPAGG